MSADLLTPTTSTETETGTYLDQIPVTYTSVHTPEPKIQTAAPKSAPRAIKAKVQDYPEDPTRMDITFIIEADVAYDAFHYGNQPELAEFGIGLCRKQGLTSVGLSDRGTPLPCNKNGDPLPDFYLQEEAPADAAGTGQKHYYSVTFSYLGED
jgi:hypothetical protein